MFKGQSLLNEFSVEEKKITLKKEEELTLPPDNTGEVLIIESGAITLSVLGKAKPLIAQSEEAYLLLPRSRGLIIQASIDTRIRIIKMNPLCINGLTKKLNQIANGMYKITCHVDDLSILDCIHKKMNFHDLYDSYAKAGTILHQSMDRIISSRGSISIKELHQTIGISKSTIEQHFIRTIGLTPKEYCRIEKFNYFLECYYSMSNYSLTELAYYCGYYDQSHLIKDFQYFLETSPRKYLQSNSIYIDMETKKGELIKTLLF